MFETIIFFINKHQLIPSHKTKLVIGLSGGPDSIFLLHILCKIREMGTLDSIIAAHLDHGWRSDSKQDVDFCAEAARDNHVEFVHSHLSEFEALLPKTGSQEDRGRNGRRLFLEKVMHEHRADAIALAHHLQDQEETFLIRLMRGTSLTGLCAMWPRHGHYIRPLLETDKHDIIKYLNNHAIAYLSDPSNELPTFLRNRIRTTVLPALRMCDSRFDHNFLLTLNRLQDIEHYLAQHTRTILETIIKKEDDLTILDINMFLSQPQPLHYRLLIQWLSNAQAPFLPTQPFLDEIIRFFKQPESKEHAMHPAWKIVKKKNNAWINVKQHNVPKK